jgi:hypothetical protein
VPTVTRYLALAALLALSNCADDDVQPREAAPASPEGEHRDAGAPASGDASAVDAASVDAAAADAAALDAREPDESPRDATVDAAMVDAATVDAAKLGDATIDAALAHDAAADIESDAADGAVDAGSDSGVDAAQPARVKACILPLGDSITAADVTHYGYRYLLWEALKNVDAEIDFVGSRRGNSDGDPDFPDKSFDEDHEGWPGYHANQVRDLLPGVEDQYLVSHALIHLGTNDVVYHGDSAESTAHEIGQIIGILRAKNPDVAILLAQIIPSNFEGADQRVPPFNAALATLAAQLDSARSPVVLVDQYTGFDPDTNTSEGTHPNASGDQKMAKRWFDALLPWLSARPCR